MQSLSFKKVIYQILRSVGGFPSGSAVKNSPADAGNLGSIPGCGRCPGEGNGNPLQYSCLENPMNRGAWQDRGTWRATVHGVAKESDTTKQLDNNKICCEFFCPLAVLVDRSHSMFVKGCLRQHMLGPKS